MHVAATRACPEVVTRIVTVNVQDPRAVHESSYASVAFRVTGAVLRYARGAAGGWEFTRAEFTGVRLRANGLPGTASASSWAHPIDVRAGGRARDRFPWIAALVAQYAESEI